MTAKVAAAGRAVESRRADRLFDDWLAAALAGEQGFREMEEWRLPGMPKENPTIGPRTRFFDDMVMAAIGHGLRQVVLVAAGMDTRAFRLALPDDTVVFELDLEGVLAEKETVLEREHARPACRRVPVPVHLEGGTWPTTLLAAGFDSPEPAVFVAEGLSSYLTEVENSHLLDDLAALAQEGSTLGIDMLSSDYLHNPVVNPFLGRLRSLGIPWQFGTNDPEAFLEGHGWRAQVHSFDAVARRLGRWPPTGVPEDLAARAAAASRNFFIDATRAPTNAVGPRPR